MSSKFVLLRCIGKSAAKNIVNLLSFGASPEAQQTHLANLAMLPFANCCLIGLPIGILAIVALKKPEVKEAFS